MNHEIGGVKGGSGTAGSIGLRSAGEVEAGVLKEGMLLVEARLIDIFGSVAENCSQDVRHHACVEILTDFKSHLSLFAERRREVLGDDLVRSVRRSERLEKI